MSDTDKDPQTHVESVLKAAEILSTPAEIRDVDPNEWLSAPQEMVIPVVVDGVRFKVAALTEAETQLLMKQNTRPNPARPSEAPRLDAMRFRLAMIAFSLNKANPNSTPITPNQLEGRKTGSLTILQEAIMDLSGMASGAQASPAFFA